MDEKDRKIPDLDTLEEQLHAWYAHHEEIPPEVARLPRLSKPATEELYRRGYAYYENANYKNARHLFTFLTTIEPFIRKHWLGFGATLQMLKDYSEALKAYGYAALLDESDPMPHVYAAECFYELKDLTQAVTALESAIALAKQENPHHPLIKQLMSLKTKWIQK